MSSAVIKWYERLSHDAEGFESGLGKLATRKLCQLNSKWVPFFEYEKAEAAKGEGRAPIQDTAVF